MASTTSGHPSLKPSASRTSHSSPQKSSGTSSSSSSIPKPPVSTHSTATVSDLATFQGTHPVTIGEGTIIHPRAKLLSFEGPIVIGDGCIIGEKAVVGGGSPSRSTSSSSSKPAEQQHATPTILENSVLIGPLATVSVGAHVRSAATVDTSALVGRGARIGKHAKVCTSCCIPDNEVVADWIVIWGANGCGMGLQRRKRPSDRGSEATDGLGGRDVESARLTALGREREGLTKLIGVAAGGRRR
jgi:carbonic anhydrase/acetyltransferase-like protein (isoleucine patch superfamily)